MAGGQAGGRADGAAAVMGEGLADEGAVVVHDVARGDRDAGRRRRRAASGRRRRVRRTRNRRRSGMALPPARPAGRPRPRRRSRARKLDHGLDRVAVAQLPGLLRPGVLGEAKSGGDLVVAACRACSAFTLEVADPAHAIVLDRLLARGAAGEIPVLVEEEEPERLDGAAARPVASPIAAVDEGDALPVLERLAQRARTLAASAWRRAGPIRCRPARRRPAAGPPPASGRPTRRARRAAGRPAGGPGPPRRPPPRARRARSSAWESAA